MGDEVWREPRMFYIGVDTGGTFTDFVALNATSGEIIEFKIPSVPEDPAEAVEAGLIRLRDQHGVEPRDIGRFVFGTTVATNAVLEHKGGRTALITTRGTRDVIEIQRLWRSHLFDLYIQKPPPLVPRRWRFEVDERIGSTGEVVSPLSPAEASRIAALAAQGQFDAVAVVGLFSFLNAAHETQVREAILSRCPQALVCISSEVSPEFREFERATTTVMNAYVMPAIHRLASRLQTGTAALGGASPLRILQSNGGLMSTATMRTQPVRTLLSGPAGGVVGAAAVAVAAGLEDVIAMDMGGTSLDICLVRDGQVRLSTEGRVGAYPVQLPQVDVHTIGAGGGSIARVIRGALKVGPQSAGAVPGPVCYGGGGTEPTSTDAAVVLGYIDAENFAGGHMHLDVAGARRAVTECIGAPLGLETDAAALAIVQVQVANIVTGVRAVSVERGLDPRGFALLPFGGAGSLYAGLVARELGIGKVFVPVHPGVLSAFGMLLTDVKYTDVVTRLMGDAAASVEEITAIFRSLAHRLRHELAEEAVAPSAMRFEASCDMRYRGQAYEVNVPVSSVEQHDLVAAMVADFHALHRTVYGQAAEGDPVEMVNFRMTGAGVVARPELRPAPSGATVAQPPKGSRTMCFPDLGTVETACYSRASLGPGAQLSGPAVVEDAGATIVVFPGEDLLVDPMGNIVIEVPVP